MRQFPLARAPRGDRTRCTPKESRYLLKSLRLGEGDSFPAVDPEGGRWEARIEAVAEGLCELSLIPVSPKVAPPEGPPPLAASESRVDAEPFFPAGAPGPAIVLFQCLPKGHKIDLIVRQAVEAGVSLIVPVESRNCVARARAEAGGRRERLERVMREALSQCGRADVPRLADPLALPEVPAAFGHFAGTAAGLGLFFHEKPLAQGTLHGYLDAEPGVVGIVVGPEGGLSPEETALLGAAGFRGVWLGPSILRAETAALYAVAAVQTLTRERASWQTRR